MFVRAKDGLMAGYIDSSLVFSLEMDDLLGTVYISVPGYGRLGQPWLIFVKCT